MLRIAIAGIVHETNTYCKDLTSLAEFRVIRGEKFQRLAGTETNVGGALAECARRGSEVVPIMVATAQPSGTIQSIVYEDFKAEILQSLEQHLPVDGVFLDLHGAGVVQHLEDLEGDLCGAIRALVGKEIPITAAFDLHGNITQAMASSLDGMFACHQYPHIDMHLRAAEAVGLLHDMIEQQFSTRIHVERLPVLLPTTTTFEGIGQNFLEQVLEVEGLHENVIDISWFHGFPYTDVGHVGSYLTVTTKGDLNEAESLGKDLARRLWHHREDFLPPRVNAEQAISEALQCGKTPVVINETSDNCGGGAPGDGTHLLRAMIDAGLKNSCFGFIVDAEVAQQAHAAGEGARITVELGGKTDDLHGEPLALEVLVKSLHNGRLTMKAMAKGASLNLGPMARLLVDDIDIIVASNRSQTFDDGPFEALGIDVRLMNIVALKSSNHFRAGFKDIAEAIVTADTPGLTTHYITVFPRKNHTDGLWPLDDSATYPG